MSTLVGLMSVLVGLLMLPCRVLLLHMRPLTKHTSFAAWLGAPVYLTVISASGRTYSIKAC